MEIRNTFINILDISGDKVVGVIVIIIIIISSSSNSSSSMHIIIIIISSSSSNSILDVSGDTDHELYHLYDYFNIKVCSSVV